MARRRRDSSETIKIGRKERRRLRAALRERQRRAGLKPAVKPTVANHLSPYEDQEQERRAREDAVSEKVAVLRAKLPTLLRKLSKIPDPRNPKKIKHKLTSLMVYGILGFVLQVASRREANREMSRPVFRENLLALFPDLEGIPHHDTLMRLLDRIDVEEIQQAQLELLRALIRKRKFQKYLVEGCYPIAIDGTQKFATYTLWDEQYLERQVGDEKTRRTQYYVYVLEANLAFRDGMTIPLMSEFLDYGQGDNEGDKQDCELRAFYRLAERLHRAFPRLPIMLLLDGLYPVGPVMELCRGRGWEYMIVLQDGSLAHVWEEYEGLKKLLEPADRHRMRWGDRQQKFHWTNDIDFSYHRGRRTRSLKLHLVVCEERWQQVDDDTGQLVTKSARHVWLSSKRLSQGNVHQRCNLAGRHRWTIESGILVEKRCGYHYEHCFSYSWNALKGYHYLMRIGHLLNVLADHSAKLVELVQELGVRGLIRFIRETLSGPWLDHQRVLRRLCRPRQIRLVAG
jgi:hypothetical protein